MKMNAEFISKDQNFQNEETVYWFNVKFDDESMVLGVAESCGESVIIDEDSCPIAGNWFESAVSSLPDMVTEDMRNDY